MITSEQVSKMFARWEYCGLKPPFSRTDAKSSLVAAFMERFKLMDEEVLEFVSTRVCSGNVWPTFSLVEQLAKEFQESNSSYVHIDYFKELRSKAYQKNESFDAFINRIANEYYPQQGQDWRKRYAFQLHFYGLCVAACENCKGACPHNGHQYHLRIKRGSSIPIPWVSMEICAKYRYSVDRDGKRIAKAHKQETFSPIAAIPDGEPTSQPTEQDNPFAVSSKQVKKAKKQDSAIQGNMFEQEMNENETYK